MQILCEFISQSLKSTVKKITVFVDTVYGADQSL